MLDKKEDKVLFHQRELNEIISKIKEKGLANKQHFLVTGKNGMGKTFLLKKVYEYTQTHNLSHQFTLYFASEQYGINRLSKFWKIVCLKLGELDDTWQSAYATLKLQHDYEQKIIPFIQQHLKQQQQSLVLIVNNFDTLIQKFTILEQHQLREILLESSIQIIGSSNGIRQNFGSYESPFFDFFRYVLLADLDWPSCRNYFALMAAEKKIKLFELEESAMLDKLYYLFLLSDKSIRQIATIFELVFIHKKKDIKDILTSIMDKVNGVYQLRMSSLAPLQQEILYYMASIWERCSVSDLEKKLNLRPNAIAGQLKLLEDQQIIKSQVLTGFERLKFYEIEDRCFNFWILWNQSNPSATNDVDYYIQWIESYHLMKNPPPKNIHIVNEPTTIYGNYFPIHIDKVISDLEWDPKLYKAIEYLEAAEFKQAEQQFIKCLQQWKHQPVFEQSMVFAIQVFYHYKQKHFLLKCFEEFPLMKQHSKPFYFSLLEDFKKEHPKKYQRKAAEFTVPM